MKLLFLGNLGFGEILLIALIVLLLFGGKKIPELMRALGRGVRSFKDGINEPEVSQKEPVNETVKESENALNADENADETAATK